MAIGTWSWTRCPWPGVLAIAAPQNPPAHLPSSAQELCAGGHPSQGLEGSARPASPSTDAWGTCRVPACIAEPRHPEEGTPQGAPAPGRRQLMALHLGPHADANQFSRPLACVDFDQSQAQARRASRTRQLESSPRPGVCAWPTSLHSSRAPCVRTAPIPECPCGVTGPPKACSTASRCQRRSPGATSH